MLPPSKSHTMRALLLASMAKGSSEIQYPLDSPDTNAMLTAISAFGASGVREKNQILVKGVGAVPDRLKASVIDAGNSGQVLRFASSFYAQAKTPVVITGDHSLRTLRPCAPLLSALRQRGAFACSLSRTQSAPILIQGPINPGFCRIDGQDSQPVSALLMALPFLKGESFIQVDNLGEKPWINLTLDWMKRVGLRYEEHSNGFYLPGSDSIEPFLRHIPGDLSALAFPLVASLITPSEISISGVDCSDVQGDKEIIDVLKAMGAQIEHDAERHMLHVKGVQKLHGISVDMNKLIDAIPALAVLSCFAEGETHLYGASIARKKECDRLHVMRCELEKMGADIEELSDGLLIRGKGYLHGARLNGHADHRVVMALSCAAFAAQGESCIDGSAYVAKSFPDFFEQFERIKR